MQQQDRVEALKVLAVLAFGAVTTVALLILGVQFWLETTPDCEIETNPETTVCMYRDPAGVDSYLNMYNRVFIMLD